MSDERITPDEFARLMALPESDPERRRAEATAEFAGMKAMLAVFQAEGAAPTAEDDAIRDELARRLAPDRPAPASATGRSPLPRAAKAPREGSGGWFAALFGAPAQRAVAVAVLVVVAGLGAWTMAQRPREDVVRGEHAGAFAVTAKPGAGGVDLSWPPVAGAEGYRVVVLGADLGEVARFDTGNVTTWTLHRDVLPGVLSSGDAITVEVQALQGGTAISSTPARAIRLP